MMKRIAAFLLVLTLILGASAAFAATGSKEAIAYIVGEGDIYIQIRPRVATDTPVGDDGAGVGRPASIEKTPAELIYEAQKNGSALDVLPEEIRSQLPAGFTKVNEILEMGLEGNLDALKDLKELAATIKFDTPYAEGEVVYLAIGIPGEGKNAVEWALLKGVANADNNVEVTFDHDTLMKIGEKTFAVMAISEE